MQDKDRGQPARTTAHARHNSLYTPA